MLLKILHRIIVNEVFSVIIIISFLYTCAYFPIIHNYTNPIPGRIYLGFLPYPIDTLGNLTLVQHGYTGHWTRNNYTSSALKPEESYSKTIYLFIGNISRITKIPPIQMFKLSTIFLSIIFIVSLWYVILHIFTNKTQRLVAFFLSLFSAGITIPNSGKGWEYIRSDSEVFQRSTIIQPHYALSAITSFMALFFLSRSIDKNNISDLLIASLLGFIAM
jgi:hypothetical protein